MNELRLKWNDIDSIPRNRSVNVVREDGTFWCVKYGKNAFIPKDILGWRECEQPVMIKTKRLPKDHPYFFIRQGYIIDVSTDGRGTSDDERYEAGNYFASVQEAEKELCFKEPEKIQKKSDEQEVIVKSVQQLRDLIDSLTELRMQLESYNQCE